MGTPRPSGSFGGAWMLAMAPSSWLSAVARCYMPDMQLERLIITTAALKLLLLLLPPFAVHS